MNEGRKEGKKEGIKEGRTYEESSYLFSGMQVVVGDGRIREKEKYLLGSAQKSTVYLPIAL